MTIATDTPPPPKAASQAAQTALIAFAVMLLGMMAYRGYQPHVGARPTESVAKQQVDLNRGQVHEFEQIPGIGPSLAWKIVSDRNERGPFLQVEELQRVPGVGEKTLDRVKPWLTVQSHGVIGTPTAETLERKPITPAKPTMVKSSKIQAGEAPIDVTSADATTLQRLPGIGPAMALKIIETRQAKPFQTVDDLRNVRGIGAKTLENLRPFVTVSKKP
jgi:competence protein ComEA